MGQKSSNMEESLNYSRNPRFLWNTQALKDPLPTAPTPDKTNLVPIVSPIF
jgi:hypothetical protein